MVDDDDVKVFVAPLGLDPLHHRVVEIARHVFEILVSCAGHERLCDRARDRREDRLHDVEDAVFLGMLFSRGEIVGQTVLQFHRTHCVDPFAVYRVNGPQRLFL